MLNSPCFIFYLLEMRKPIQILMMMLVGATWAAAPGGRYESVTETPPLEALVLLVVLAMALVMVGHTKRAKARTVKPKKEVICELYPFKYFEQK